MACAGVSIDQLDRHDGMRTKAATYQGATMDISEQERQMVEILREWGQRDDCRLLIELQDGAWNITLSTEPHDERHKARGTGASFNAAWDNVDPLWA